MLSARFHFSSQRSKDYLIKNNHCTFFGTVKIMINFITLLVLSGKFVLSVVIQLGKKLSLRDFSFGEIQM